MKDISRERVYCDYSFFLFTLLYDIVIMSDLDYCELYGVICDEYGKYCDSNFNNPEETENECIIKYLYSIKPQ